MDILKVIAELRQECARIDDAIASLERLSSQRTPRRGRPPAWSNLSGLSVSQSRNVKMKAAAAQPRPRTERAFLALVLRMNRDLANSEI